MVAKARTTSGLVSSPALRSLAKLKLPPAPVRKSQLKRTGSGPAMTKAGLPRKARRPYEHIPAKMSKEAWRKHQLGMAERWPVPGYMHQPPPEGAGQTYRDETYITITRWTKDTRIEYRPHAKSPGSKSHVRYESYSKAKTVGEALKLKSYPQDWCWDYEHGFIRIVGGRIREEPLDSSEVDLARLDEVDQILARWFVREAARMLGISLKQISEDREAKDALLLRMRRTTAEAAAKEILAQGRPVTDADVLAVLRKWGFKKNYGRINVLPCDAAFVFSDTVGLVSDRKGCIAPTPYTLPYPSVMRVLTQYLKDQDDDLVRSFAYTSININKNYAGRLHRDGSNLGPSIIKAFGKFTGGQLNYYPNDDRAYADVEQLPRSDAVKLDLSKHVAMFDGRRGHSVDAFKGERYTLVYFTCPRNERVLAGPRAKLTKDCGFNMPSAATTSKALKVLAEPLGYKVPSACRTGARKASGPQWMVWQAASVKDAKRCAHR